MRVLTFALSLILFTSLSGCSVYFDPSIEWEKTKNKVKFKRDVNELARDKRTPCANPDLRQGLDSIDEQSLYRNCPKYP